jgi:hypothetical protein
MIDAPEPTHQHHPAHTGHRWLDMSLALSAMFVSVVSLVVAVRARPYDGAHGGRE